MRVPGCRLVLSFGLLLALAARADAAPGAGAPDQVDITPVKHELKVLSDGQGHYFVVRQVKMSTHLYYGDGRSFYALRVIGSGSNRGRDRYNAYFWAPRADRSGRATLEKADGAWRAKCGKRETIVNELPAPDAQKVLDTAAFYSPLWKHRAYALARNDKGIYYYVDKLRDEFGGHGFRLWVGQRGAMKKQKMINIVSDSEGDIFATKKGDLRLILDRKDATWVRGKKRSHLTYVPVGRNVYMIYAQLGVYIQRLGTPCDDL